MNALEPPDIEGGGNAIRLAARDDPDMEALRREIGKT